jgi:hypothetical protein
MYNAVQLSNGEDALPHIDRARGGTMQLEPCLSEHILIRWLEDWFERNTLGMIEDGIVSFHLSNANYKASRYETDAEPLIYYIRLAQLVRDMQCANLLK